MVAALVTLILGLKRTAPPEKPRPELGGEMRGIDSGEYDGRRGYIEPPKDRPEETTRRSERKRRGFSQ